MENIIKKAIKGGYTDHCYCNEFDIYEGKGNYCYYATVCDPLFWQALSKACRWEELFIVNDYNKDFPIGFENAYTFAMKFHEINLTKGFEEAVKYLEERINLLNNHGS